MSGSVTVLAGGSKVDVRVGATLRTPLRIETANDGSLHIEQESSGLDIGPNSVIVLPGTAPSSKLEKIKQELGRVLYSVKPRKTRSFTVETPYLVSVVKGTTFSVAIDQQSATVALLEGSVEVGNPDLAETILLQPNQIARRAAGERSIAVTTFDASKPLQARTGISHTPVAQAASDQHGSSSIQNELREITAAYSDRRTRSRGVVPSAPVQPPPGTGGNTPGSDPSPPPADPSVPTNPDPAPQPPPDTGGHDDTDDNGSHDDDDDNSSGDGDDGNSGPGSGDHNNGHGNDEDGEDEGNPGKGRNRHPRR